MPRGILCMIGATVLFAIAAALAKWQVAIYPIGEVMFFRSFFSLVVCAAVILPLTGFAVFATRRPRDAHRARPVAIDLADLHRHRRSWLMPLAGAIAINFSAPLFAALLSIIWLKERAGPARWIALLAGFFGVLIVTNPGRGLAHDRRAVRARQCGDVRQRHRRGARHDEDRNLPTRC